MWMKPYCFSCLIGVTSQGTRSTSLQLVLPTTLWHVVKQFYWPWVLAVTVGSPSLAQSLYGFPSHCYRDRAGANLPELSFLLLFVSCWFSLLPPQLSLQLSACMWLWLSAFGEGLNLTYPTYSSLYLCSPSVANEWVHVDWHQWILGSDQHHPEHGKTAEAADPGAAAQCQQRDGASAAGTDPHASHHWKEGDWFPTQGLHSDIKVYTFFQNFAMVL